MPEPTQTSIKGGDTEVLSPCPTQRVLAQALYPFSLQRKKGGGALIFKVSKRMVWAILLLITAQLEDKLYVTVFSVKSKKCHTQHLRGTCESAGSSPLHQFSKKRLGECRQGSATCGLVKSFLQYTGGSSPSLTVPHVQLRWKRKLLTILKN